MMNLPSAIDSVTSICIALANVDSSSSWFSILFRLTGDSTVTEENGLTF